VYPDAALKHLKGTNLQGEWQTVSEESEKRGLMGANGGGDNSNSRNYLQRMRYVALTKTRWNVRVGPYRDRCVWRLQKNWATIERRKLMTPTVASRKWGYDGRAGEFYYLMGQRQSAAKKMIMYGGYGTGWYLPSLLYVVCGGLDSMLPATAVTHSL
jgi:hypothetical protein